MIRTLFVGNLPWVATEEDLAAFFGALGALKGARVVTEPETGRSRGYGFIEVDEDIAARALAMHGHNIGGRRIIVGEVGPGPPLA